MQPWAERQATRRATLLAALFALWMALIAGRLVDLQVFRHHAYRKQSETQTNRLVTIPAPRGRILDRAGRTLALSIPVESVVVNPRRTRAYEVTAGILGPVLGLDQRQLEQALAAAAANRRGFFRVKSKVSLEEAERLRDLPLNSVDFQGESLRAYPKGPLASHILGGVDFQEKGNAGIEQALDAELSGEPGMARVITDVVRRAVDSRTEVEAVPGKNVTLTIDERVQHVAERELARAVQQSRSRTGSVVAMDPKTGDILALASYPPYDANQPVASKEDMERRANHALSVPFEPGSVFKLVTVAAALETTSLTPESVVNCGGGRINLFGRVIHDHDPYGFLPVSEVLARSSNIGAIQIGLAVGARNLLDYVRRFGFGRATGIPLPGESSGKVRGLESWSRTSIGSVAMGHEISVTTVQLAQAVSAIANGGLLVRPRLVLRKQRPGQPPENVPLQPAQRVMRPETSIAMRRMMEGVVLHGTGTRARLDGYTAGGKTGSAQIYDPACHCYKHVYNASFAGFAPVVNPAVVVVVTINGSSVFGGAVAAPVFREVATAALRLLDVPRDLPDPPPPREDEPAGLADLAIAELGSPAALLPEPGIPAEARKPAGPLDLWGPRVPDFYGKTMRAVLEESAQTGLPVEPIGSGIVRAQAPAPGSVLPRGERVQVLFSR
jgi:cell division protein FtsI (penicillin-binding protein 3)